MLPEPFTPDSDPIAEARGKGRMTPSAEQQEAIDRMASEWTGAALSGSDLGTGKTLMAVETAIARGAGTVLIIGPLHTRYGWADTVELQAGAQLRWIRNDKSGNLAEDDLRNGVPGWYFIGREYTRSLDWKKFKTIDFVAVDEVHYASNRQSKSFKTLRKIREKATFMLAQSATWMGSSFEGAWSAPRALWDDDEVIAPFRFWRGYYCTTEYTPFGYDKVKVVGEKEPGAFAKDLPCYINLRAKHGADPVFIPVYVDLSPSQRKIYDSLEKSGVAWLEENPLVTELSITTRIRLRQVTIAEPIITDDGAVDFADDAKSTKLDALDGLLEDLAGEKALIVTDSERAAQLIAKRTGAGLWVGATKDRDRKALLDDFMHSDLRLIVATHGSIAEGTDGLQRSARVLIEVSAHDRMILNEQVVGRLHRRGQERQVVVYQIRARDTYDDPQAETLLRKTLASRQSMLKT